MGAFERSLARFFPPLLSDAPTRARTPGAKDVTTVVRTLSQIPAQGVAPLQISYSGFAVLLDPASHAGANLEIAFDRQPSTGSSTEQGGWQPWTPGKTARPTGGNNFERFYVRKRSTVPASLDPEECYFVIDPDSAEGAFDPRPRAAQITPGGALATLLQALTLAGLQVDVRASDEGALANAWWTGAAYVRALGTAAGRLAVNLIGGEEGITGGAGAVAANTPRATLASDDPAVTSLAVIDDWDEANRAAVNPIAGQVGLASNVGIATAAAPRVVRASPAVGEPAAHVTVAAAASTVVAPANASRYSVLIRNADPANSVFLELDGTAAVAATGFELKAGEGVSFAITGVIAAIGDGVNAVDVHVLEESF